ncbi:hypothetical protein MM221_15065 [Salipaludibacillus sp. LMS25]|uniref:hypothetical protein n=1 Tax=Salipaludibacillus sp. LMS25 TaxID=2924031 RepID=UPI0020D0BA9C|nr:hypothetical protein [Salipaludibacillus sp. LMS25]UTR13919.1 hypothetical protein MM221_15065 [Salipaludibacillus sp. LMS25]
MVKKHYILLSLFSLISGMILIFFIQMLDVYRDLVIKTTHYEGDLHYTLLSSNLITVPIILLSVAVLFLIVGIIAKK